MSCLPRAAVGTIQPGAVLAPVYWALLDGLNRRGLQVQGFESKACFSPRDGVTPITGLHRRHLDSWLMSREMCREIFFRAAEEADVALVEGSLTPPAAELGELGSRLTTLCDWLELPRVAVVDVALLANGPWPERPAADALLLDCVPDAEAAQAWQHKLQSLWNAPVLGWLPERPVLRDMISGLPLGAAPPIELCRALGQDFEPHFDSDAFLRLCARRAFGAPPSTAVDCDRAPVHVAVAYDEAFHCYFPDALDMLELSGAIVRDFSPLADESLPPDTEIAYFGCGHPEAFAERLAENHCLMSELRNHVCAGRRIYAESGGLAYMCRELVRLDGERFPMVGAIPAVACPNPHPLPPEPLEIALGQDCWLGAAGQVLRGYRNSMWELEPAGSFNNLARGGGAGRDLVSRRNAIGSRLHLNFAVLPSCLQRFTEPLATMI